MSTDRLPTVGAANAVLPFVWSCGIRYDGEGRIIVTTTGAIVNFLNGLPRDEAGNLCITEA